MGLTACSNVCVDVQLFIPDPGAQIRSGMEETVNYSACVGRKGKVIVSQDRCVFTPRPSVSSQANALIIGETHSSLSRWEFWLQLRPKLMKSKLEIVENI